MNLCKIIDLFLKTLLFFFPAFHLKTRHEAGKSTIEYEYHQAVVY